VGGLAYLATVIDLASRKLVGWAMADHKETSLVCEAMALADRRPPPGLMFHSDYAEVFVKPRNRGLACVGVAGCLVPRLNDLALSEAVEGLQPVFGELMRWRVLIAGVAALMACRIMSIVAKA
jgi:hypothetical protein